MEKSTAVQLEELNQKCLEQQRQITDLSQKVKRYEDYISLMNKKRFGRSSEKSDADQLTLFDDAFFNEAEKEAAPQEEPTLETVTYTRKKQKQNRESYSDSLPVETIDYRLPVEEQVCPCCNGELHEMSSDVRRELHYVPAELKVIEHRRFSYSCRHCHQSGTETPIISAPIPQAFKSKSMASPSLVAHIMNQKYVDHVPLYRQEQAFARQDITLSRQTMANWMIHGAAWLRHLYSRLHEELLNRSVLHADETTLKVINEKGRESGQTSYMWLYRTGREGPPIVLYDYQTTRAAKHLLRFLKDFKGYLHTDGYQAYQALGKNVTLVGCWAHARRNFHEALSALPNPPHEGQSLAKEGLHFCNQLFEIDRDLGDVSAERRYEVRQEKSAPLLEAFLTWLNQQKHRVLTKSLIGKAIHYALNQWDRLVNYLKDGRLECSNNRAERSIKPFVIGRKNWIFCNTEKGAGASSIIYSIIETAKENGCYPFRYLEYLFEKLPTINCSDPHEIDRLLPWSNELPDSCKTKA